MLKDGNNVIEAYRVAYPNDKQGTRNAYSTKARPRLKAYLQARRENMENKEIASEEYILTSLRKLADECLKGLPVFQGGEEVGRKIDQAGVARALELLGKTKGMFNSEVTINGLDKIVSDLQQSGDDIASNVGS